MHRDRQHEAGSNHRHVRKEWGRGGDSQHQMEAREHTGQPGRTQRAHHVREDEALRQIRELRGRYRV